MELQSSLEPTPEYRWMELARGARKFVEEVFPIRCGENVLVIADTLSDWRVVQEMTRAIYALGATPAVVLYPATSVAYSEPPRPITGAMAACDALIGLEVNSLFHTRAWREAMRVGVRTTALSVDADMFVRMVAGYSYSTLVRMVGKLVALATAGKTLRIKSDAGTDLQIAPGPVLAPDSEVKPAARYGVQGKGTFQVPPGQAPLGHTKGSINGILVFDGAIFPPEEINVLKDTVRLEIEGDVITKIVGGPEARTFERWLHSWNHPDMFRVVHCNYGCNPGVRRCKGNMCHDERVFGALNFGMGRLRDEAVPAHTDGVMLSPSVWADDVQLEDNGHFVHPELVALARELGAEGY